MYSSIKTEVSSAEMILLGIGEEFNDINRLQKDENYRKGKLYLVENDLQWLIPSWNQYCSAKLVDIITPALKKISEIIENKNYFVISTANDCRVAEHNWKEGRIVMPCGYSSRKQCAKKCIDNIEIEKSSNQLHKVTEGDKIVLEYFFNCLYDGDYSTSFEYKLGRCPSCGSELIFNTIYAQNYDENGYLGKWSLYQKWLTGTLNKKLLLLELGVNMQFPSVIRWPFEKITFYNQKSSLIRVNDKLYQPAENISDRTISVAQNAIEWILNL